MGIGLQITEISLIQNMPSHKHSGQNVPYQHSSQTCSHSVVSDNITKPPIPALPSNRPAALLQVTSDCSWSEIATGKQARTQSHLCNFTCTLFSKITAKVCQQKLTTAFFYSLINHFHLSTIAYHYMFLQHNWQCLSTRTECFYSIFTATVLQKKFTTVCFYTTITTDVNKTYHHIFLPVRPSPVLCFSLVMLTQLRCHHNSHSLLSAEHRYSSFSFPVKTKHTLWCEMHFLQMGNETFQTQPEVQCMST